jgi:BirA family biotin operon repressor/biotin-[acetyl-CoA-carboxylase] ligase
LSTVDNSNIVGKVLYEFESLPSTNLHAVELLASAQPEEGTVILATYQSAGRGQMGTQWVSFPGLNLTLSVILRPEFLEVKDQFYLNKAISLAVFELVKQYLPNKVSIKWPNDIMIEGRKVGGILIQNGVQGKRWQWSVAGIGLNINQKEFPSELLHATSLCLETSLSFDLLEIRAKLFHLLDDYYRTLREDHKALDLCYREALYRRNKETTFVQPLGEELYGSIQDVDSLGRLIIKDLNGQHRLFSLKEIAYR